MRAIAAGVALLLLAPVLAAQAPRPSDQELEARMALHRGDFDYLLGQWTFTAQHQHYGRFRGSWTAVRLEGPATILDEYRATGDTGETYAVSNTLRVYNAVADQWELVSVDGGDGLRNIGTAHMVGDEMRIEQTFGATSPEPSQWRIRYYHIRPDGFSWAADRSTDNGRTWVTNYMQIEATRIGPPPRVAPLAPARRTP